MANERSLCVEVDYLSVKTGIAANHHFLTPKDGNSFRFTEGHYKLDIFARLLGDKKPIMLFSQELDISREIAVALEEAGRWFVFRLGARFLTLYTAY